MKRPDEETRAKYVQPDGEFYSPTSPPPWEPRDGTKWDKNIFGAWFECEPNLPYACDPRYERYWTM